MLCSLLPQNLYVRISGPALHLRNHEIRYHCGSCGYTSLSRGVFSGCRRSTPNIERSQKHRTASDGMRSVRRRLSCLRVEIGGRTAGQYSSVFALVFMPAFSACSRQTHYLHKSTIVSKSLATPIRTNLLPRNMHTNMCELAINDT